MSLLVGFKLFSNSWNEPILTSPQFSCSQILQNFSKEACNPLTLFSLVCGGAIARSVELSCLKLLSSFSTSSISRFSIHFASLTGVVIEGSVFAGTPMLSERGNLSEWGIGSTHGTLVIGLSRVIRRYTHSSFFISWMAQDCTVVGIDLAFESLHLRETKNHGIAERLFHAQAIAFQMHISGEICHIIPSTRMNRANFEIQREIFKQNFLLPTHKRISKMIWGLREQRITSSGTLPDPALIEFRQSETRKIESIHFMANEEDAAQWNRFLSKDDRPLHDPAELLAWYRKRGARENPLLLFLQILSGEISIETAKEICSQTPIFHHRMSVICIERIIKNFNRFDQSDRMSDGKPLPSFSPFNLREDGFIKTSVLDLGGGPSSLVRHLLDRGGFGSKAPEIFELAPYLAIDLIFQDYRHGEWISSPSKDQLDFYGKDAFGMDHEFYSWEAIQDLQRRFPNHFRYGVFQDLNIVDPITRKRMRFDEIVSHYSLGYVLPQVWLIEGMTGVRRIFERIFLHLNPGGKIRIFPLSDPYRSVGLSKLPSNEHFFQELRNLFEEFIYKDFIQSYGLINYRRLLSKGEKSLVLIGSEQIKF